MHRMRPFKVGLHSCGTGGQSLRPILTMRLVNGELRYLIEHPTETRDRTHEQQSRLERETGVNDLKDSVRNPGSHAR